MRKNIQLFLLCLLSGLFFTACEQDIANYKETDSRIYFSDNDAYTLDDTLIRHTFVYYLENIQVDTIWLDVSTSGFVADHARPFAFKQVMTGKNDAVAGKHYVAFNDPQIAVRYIIPAGKAHARVPLVVKRDDPGLDTAEMTLRLSFAENESFKCGFRDSLNKTVMISDILTQPDKWDFLAGYYMVGAYGKVKHRFMMQVTAPLGILINDDFFATRVNGDAPDMGVMSYWFGFFYNALEEENARRKAEGKDVLREAPEPGETIGRIVEFTQFVN